MRFLFCLILLLPVGSVSSQGQKFGDWTSYLSHSQAVGTATRDGQIFTITSGGMYQYDPEFGEVKTFSTVNGLSGINPTAIHHAEEAGLIVIGYANGMVDFFSNP